MNGGPLGVPFLWAAAYAVAGAAVLLLVLRTRRTAPEGWLAALATIAAVLLAVRPGWERVLPPDPVVLLTEGAAPSLPDGLRGDRFRLPGVAAEAPSAEPIPDAAWLRRHRPGAPELEVAGHGLPPWEWDPAGPPVRWAQRPDLSAGIREVTWPRRIPLGGLLRVRGRLARRSDDERTVLLRGPAGVVSSARIAPGAEPAFTLDTVPRGTGRLVYRVGTGGATEAIDVEVVPPRGISVLWLESAPSFETRAFRDWLRAGPGALAVRTAISRDRHRREYQGIPEVDLARITPGLLARFDLVVLDAGAWADLSASERDALRAAAEDRGLGLLLRPDGEIPAAPPWAGFRAAPVGDLERRTARVRWPGSDAGVPLDLAAREILLPRDGVPLAVDGAGRVLAASRPDGRGRAGISLLEGTFRWALEGHPERHQRLWAFLVGSLARPDPSPRWLAPAGPVLVDAPLAVELRAPAVPVPAATVVDPAEAILPLALRQDPFEPGRWTARFWPDAPGWYRLQVAGGAAVSFRAQDRESWRTWQEWLRQAATTRQVATAGLQPAPSVTARGWRRLPPGPLVALLLGCLYILWFRERW
ncbi:MAG: hypothetical protein PVF68_08015 [Acidobacteriota bacterium]